MHKSLNGGDNETQNEIGRWKNEGDETGETETIGDSETRMVAEAVDADTLRDHDRDHHLEDATATMKKTAHLTDPEDARRHAHLQDGKIEDATTLHQLTDEGAAAVHHRGNVVAIAHLRQKGRRSARAHQENVARILQLSRVKSETHLRPIEHILSSTVR